MIDLKQYEFWFVTGSQDLYGDETLRQVADDSRKVVESLNTDARMPCKIVWKPTVLTSEGIRAVLEEANASGKCAGVIAWMHTFSPAKMWIAGLNSYKKPLLQLNTQFNRDILRQHRLDFTIQSICPRRPGVRLHHRQMENPARSSSTLGRG